MSMKNVKNELNNFKAIIELFFINGLQSKKCIINQFCLVIDSGHNC